MKPIIFSTDMVQAILSGDKTMTRRPVKPKGKTYQVGDVLWVREIWAKISDWTGTDPAVGLPDGYIYKADWQGGTEHPRWRSPIYMPKEAARIFLRVTDVRMERLQDITVEDCIKEGIDLEWTKNLQKPSYSSFAYAKKIVAPLFIASYRSLWDNLNIMRGYGWDSNPLVHVIEFERIAERGSANE